MYANKHNLYKFAWLTEYIQIMMRTIRPSWRRQIILYIGIFLSTFCGLAQDEIFRQARVHQREGNHDEAILLYIDILSQPVDPVSLNDENLKTCSEALMQLMNTYQSKGEPEACVLTLKELFKESALLQKQCLRDYYSVLGYALSRTEKMKEAEETTLKAFNIPLYHATPERYFRDYAYAAAVFYSNPDYQDEVIGWCEEALRQAELCGNTSGKQWVSSMLGSLYKRKGEISKALEMFQASKAEAQKRNDALGLMNSLHSLIDLFLFWNVPEYADVYASEAVRVEQEMTIGNPMVSAQAYIDKGRTLLQLGKKDSVSFYIEKARELCCTLPYNSGMVDVDLLEGIHLTDIGGDSMNLGIHDLQQVTIHGTAANRAKAYHQLAQTYLKDDRSNLAEVMLDSLYTLLDKSDSPIYIHVDYKPILNHYLNSNNQRRAEEYTRLMLQEQQALKERKLNFNLVEAIVDHETALNKQELSVMTLRQSYQRIWFLVCTVLFCLIISAIVAFLLYQKRQHVIHINSVDEQMADLLEKLNQSNAEKDMIAQEIDNIMNDKESRQELETLAPSILLKQGESRFRQRFELLYPLFLPRLRELVPTITRREELLSMLILLKQDNKEIAELLAIAPRSVLMLRHRFRQKLGLVPEQSLEDFIENIIGS